MFDATPTDPAGLILTPLEAARQRGMRRIRKRLAGDAAMRLLDAPRRGPAGPAEPRRPRKG